MSAPLAASITSASVAVRRPYFILYLKIMILTNNMNMSKTNVLQKIEMIILIKQIFLLPKKFCYH